MALLLGVAPLIGCDGRVTVQTRDDVEPTKPDTDSGTPRDDAGVSGPDMVDGDDEVIVVDQKPVERCGDATLSETETCDDGNTEGDDGCSADCSELEEGFSCPVVGAPCKRVTVCGDALQTGGETCDDGNAEGGDGCSAACFIEADFACFTPGEACESTVECGDGKVTGDETCDDGNGTAGDGCDARCETEAGWLCQSAGLPCQPECGDGLMVGRESCDDGNLDPEDGCSDTCRREHGYACDEPGQPCRTTVCGDGMKEGDEPCDDGADIHVGDGCSPGCVLEPACTAPKFAVSAPSADAGLDSADGGMSGDAGAALSSLYEGGECSSGCGDGLILAGDDEECDDGNNSPGDGCDSECRVEDGFDCELFRGELPDELVLPVVYRDFVHRVASGGTTPKHPDFETYSGLGTPDLVEPLLDVDGKPLYTGICEEGQTLDDALCPSDEQTTSAADFAQWYRDTDGVNVAVPDTLVFTRQPGDTYVFDSGDGFFPLDDRGWLATDPPEEATSGGHNFGFTTELRYWFEFQGGEFLDFSGDDDVWVFIGGRLVVDLGGLHPRQGASVTLDEPTAEALGLELGRIYEMALFHAERHTDKSNFKLTIGGFLPAETRCSALCGDGIVAGDERCDDGENNGAGYGFCTDECLPGERCGDGVPNGDEACDNGVNLSGYLSEADPEACAPGCVLPPSCGDGSLDAAFGEQCDAGEDNDGAYDGCNADCTLGPRCGDGIKNGDEECDDGNLSNKDSCDAACKSIIVADPM